jgi:ribonuclease HII
MATILPDWSEELAAQSRGFRTIVGLDEAGRGCAAGPVVAACVQLPIGIDLPGICDSKLLSPAQRARCYDFIQANATSITVGIIDVQTIDRINILRAAHQAFRECIRQLAFVPDLALIDGLRIDPFPVAQRAVVKGDQRSLSIAAASIVAKVTRDRLMEELHEAHPYYGFASNKGYPTPDHKQALEKHGPCAAHRLTWATVLEAIAPRLEFDEDDQRRKATGETGEALAAKHLSRLGWEILTNRFHCPVGEIDLIARDGEVLAFVEVKTRHGSHAAESVTSRKRQRLTAAAEHYVLSNPHDGPLRFDVVEVLIDRRGTAEVRLIQDAFWVGE